MTDEQLKALVLSFDPDTHCFDEDTKTDVWSYSKEMVLIMLAKVREDETTRCCTVINQFHCWIGPQAKKEITEQLRSLK